MTKRLKLGMIGGGQGAFIGAVHRLCARMDDKYEFVAGCLSSTPEKAAKSAVEIGLHPSRSGAAGGVGDIGSHTMHLLEFITQLKLQSVSADLTTFVEGRKLDDDASIMIRLNNGAKGSLSISQVATGEENNFTVAIYGDKGALKWSQENPNYATFSQVGESSQIITRGGSIKVEGTEANVRIPAGHPEGYLEAFAQIYSDAADVIQNKENKEELLKILPNIDDGLHIMKFINASVESSNNDSAWTDLSTIK